jgi:hypothetical protein
MKQGYSMGGKMASRSLKKRREQEKRAARKRLRDAIERMYVDWVSGCVVTVLRRGHAYGAEPVKGVSQRDHNKRRFG